LRRHIDELRKAAERDPKQRGRRGDKTGDPPDLRLPETIEALREACEQELRRA
jgi:hypothetical protein